MSLICKPETKWRVCTTVENSPNPLSVYINICKYRKKSLLRFYKITFPREKALLFRARIDKGEISYQSRGASKFNATISVPFKHERGWENLSLICKPETKWRVCTTVENSPNPLSVYINICKYRKKKSSILL